MASIGSLLVIELCGILVGFTLALTGSGGSTLGIPLLLYVVGIDDMHLVIGTSALALSVNAYTSLIPHARAGNVLWRDGILFALTGVAGALAATELGKRVDSDTLIILFAILMLAVAAVMFHRSTQQPDNNLTRHVNHRKLRLTSTGLASGTVAGFFGVGGGFIIVPSLILATRMTTAKAIGTSLVGVGSFGLATAFSYAHAGWVDWPLAGKFIVGGIFGGWLGALAVKKLSAKKGMLDRIFSVMLVSIALYMMATF